MIRRTFLKQAGLFVPAALAAPSLARAATGPAARPGSANKTSSRELAVDLVIIGGGMGGIAAALAASRAGLRVIMTEETDWIGGQLTSQAVPPDEHAQIETFGGTKSYQAFRRGVKFTGCTVHHVTAEVDGGPIIDQAAVRIEPGDTLEVVAAKVHAAEHALLPAVIARLSEAR